MKIMVVDDEPLINQYIVQCIRNADPENEIIGAVTSGAAALRKMEETPPDLVFADITMPKMDGIELLREIKKRDPSISVIMLTCHDDFEYARAAMQNRASNYILKNEVSVEQIRAVLQEVERSRKERSAKGVAQQISRNSYLRRLAEQDISVQPIREGDLRANHIYLADRAFVVVLFQNRAQSAGQMQQNLNDRFDNPLFMLTATGSSICWSTCAARKRRMTGQTGRRPFSTGLSPRCRILSDAVGHTTIWKSCSWPLQRPRRTGMRGSTRSRYRRYAAGTASRRPNPASCAPLSSCRSATSPGAVRRSNG